MKALGLVTTPLAAVSAFSSLPPRVVVTRSSPSSTRPRQQRQRQTICSSTHIFARKDDSGEKQGISSYESSASVTKGLVSSLTSLTNSIFGGRNKNVIQNATDDNVGDAPNIKRYTTNSPPTSPEELLHRIKIEYTQNNYLWTGNIDAASFVSNCTFSDPTISFVGVDNYIKNVGNLVPIINYALGANGGSNSTLLEITLVKDKGYIQTRWNMIGELNRLFWKPKIDVIGRTKFWYQQQQRQEKIDNHYDDDFYYQVYFYDEEWEIPAGLALLQLITPAGTIRRSDEDSSEKRS
jgi:hypothetical protein